MCFMVVYTNPESSSCTMTCSTGRRLVIVFLCLYLVLDTCDIMIEWTQGAILKLEEELNALEPKAKRKKIGGRMFVPPRHLDESPRLCRSSLFSRWSKSR